MLISIPIGHWVRALSGVCRYHRILSLSFGASFPVYGLCVKIEPYFPAASTRIHPQSSYRIISEGDRFPVSFRANSGQKPVALFRRFVCVGWNPRSFFIAITLIVSVTASRRAPQLGRIFLLLPLDSPLSEKSDVADKEFSVGFALAGEIRLSVSGVCPFLFCALIISSILHNVKRFLRLFRLHIAQQKAVHFGDLALFSKCGIWYNKSVGACEASGPCADAARVRHGYGAQLAGPDIADDTSELQ